MSTKHIKNVEVTYEDNSVEVWALDSTDVGFVRKQKNHIKKKGGKVQGQWDEWDDVEIRLSIGRDRT